VVPRLTVSAAIAVDCARVGGPIVLCVHEAGTWSSVMFISESRWNACKSAERQSITRGSSTLRWWLVPRVRHVTPLVESDEGSTNMPGLRDIHRNGCAQCRRGAGLLSTHQSPRLNSMIANSTQATPPRHQRRRHLSALRTSMLPRWWLSGRGNGQQRCPTLAFQSLPVKNMI